MPRPQLKRRNKNRSSSRPRSADTGSSPRRELERKLANKSVGQRPSDSDDSDRLVTRSSSRQGRQGRTQEIFMSGGVAIKDKPGSHPTRAQTKRNTARTTRDILAREKSRSTDRDSSASRNSNAASEPEATSITKQSKSVLQQDTKKIQPQPATSSSQAWPINERSILGGIKPRKRQPSILRMTEDSTLGSIDDDSFLPEAESTPLNLTKKPTSFTPASSELLSSGSKKRKAGIDETPQQPGSNKRISLDGNKTMDSEPQLPPMPVSALRTAGQKQRRQTMDDDDDVMAPPASSSSAESPKKINSDIVKSPTLKKSRNELKAPVSMSTAELQALMPSKPRSTQQRVKPKHELKIPEDSSEQNPATDVDDADDSFAPRKSRRGRANSSKGTSTAKAVQDGNRAGGGKNSKGRVKPGVASVSKSTRLTTPLSQSQTNNETKSPSQPQVSSTIKTVPRSTDKAKQSGGYRRLRSTHSGVGDKENLDTPAEGIGSVTESVEEEEITTPVKKLDKSTQKAVINKWADIDAWDMDFEEVSVVTGSSSPMRR